MLSTNVRAQTSSRRTRLVLRLSLLLWSIVLAAGAAADTGEEFVPANPSNMLAMAKYYDIQELADAAAALRRDADRFGLDVHEHPAAGNVGHPYTVVHLPVTLFKPDFGDDAYLRSLSDKGARDGGGGEFVAILAVHRELSIDEVAGIFESGVRILEKLFAGPAQEYFGGYIVQGPATALVALSDREYFSWLGEYGTNLKWREDFGPSSLNWYSITLYKRQIADTYCADLEALGARVMDKSAQFRTIDVECSWDIVQRILELDWVRSMCPNEGAVSDVHQR